MESEYLITELAVVDGVSVSLRRRADGFPMRRVANGRRSIPVGQFFSTKNGFGVPWESRNELLGIYHAEVRSDVVGYQTQPYSFEIGIGQNRQIFTPDLGLKLVSGQHEVIEVKDDLNKLVSDNRYVAKLNLTARACTYAGWDFKLVDREELLAEPRFGVVEQVQAYRRTLLTARDVQLVIQLFDSKRSPTVGDLKGVFPSPLIGTAKMCAMIVRRIVEVDYSAGLTDAAPVFLLPKGTGHA